MLRLFLNYPFFLIFRAIPQDKSLFLTLETNGCAGTETEVNYLEHVQILITVNSTRRGDLELFTRSPMGTRSVSVSALVFQWRFDVIFINIFFFQIQVHDFEYQTQRRWFQGWLHKMAIYDNPHLGWISQRKMVPWGRFKK